MKKTPYTNRKNQQSSNTKRHQITIADRLRTVSWGKEGHQSDVIKPVYGIQAFPLKAKAM